jgi:putative DNA primase/helicase
MTTVSPAPPGAPTPIWDTFLMEAMQGDQSLVGFVHNWFGYGLSGDVSWEVFVILWGTGRNGKGVIRRTVATILGDYAITMPAEVLMERKHPGHPTEIARLAGARMVTASETDHGSRLNLSRIKELTGNEGKIAGRFMHRDFFEFPQTHKLSLITNEQPVLTQVGPAIIERVLMLPFLFRPTAPDPRLKVRLIAEYPAILRKLMEGAQRVYLAIQANALADLVPDKVQAASQEYFARQDPVAGWVRARTVVEVGATVGLREAFKDHESWAHRECRAACYSERELSDRLHDLYPQIGKSRRNTGMVLRGLRLRPLSADGGEGCAAAEAAHPKQGRSCPGI